MSAEPCDHKPSLLRPKKILFVCVCWLCWVFVAAHGLSPAAELGLYCCACAFSSCRAGAMLQLQRTGLAVGTPGSVVAAYRLSHCVACETFPDQGSNLCSLHWQVDSLPLDHQGSPKRILFKELG